MSQKLWEIPDDSQVRVKSSEGGVTTDALTLKRMGYVKVKVHCNNNQYSMNCIAAFRKLCPKN